MNQEQVLLDNGRMLVNDGQAYLAPEEEIVNKDYEELDNLPQVNDVTLIGNKSLDDLGAQEKLVPGENIAIEDNVISCTYVGKSYLLILSTNVISVSSMGLPIPNNISASLYVREGLEEPADISSLCDFYHRFDNGEAEYGSSVALTTESIEYHNRISFCAYSKDGHVLLKEWADVPIIRDGIHGAPGIAFSYIYARATSMPTIKAVDDHLVQDDDYCPDMIFDGVHVESTLSPSGVDQAHPYEFVSMRIKQVATGSTQLSWGAFSTPAQYANYAKPVLDEQTKADIVKEVTDVTEVAIRRVESDLEDTIDDLAGTKRDLLAAQGDIATHGTSISTINEEYDALNGIVGTHTASLQTQSGELTSLGARMDAAEGTITAHATRMDTLAGNITDVSDGLNAETGERIISVAKAQIYHNEDGELLDKHGNALYFAMVEEEKVRVYQKDGDYYEDEDYETEWTGPTPEQAFYADDWEIGIANVVAMSYIGQKAGEIDLIAQDGEKSAAIVMKALDQKSGGQSVVTINADQINMDGTTTQKTANITNGNITNATIENGTIDDAEINNCTINSDLKSSDFVPGQPGFSFGQDGTFEINGSAASGGAKISNSGIDIGEAKFSKLSSRDGQANIYLDNGFVYVDHKVKIAPVGGTQVWVEGDRMQQQIGLFLADDIWTRGYQGIRQICTLIITNNKARVYNGVEEGENEYTLATASLGGFSFVRIPLFLDTTFPENIQGTPINNVIISQSTSTTYNYTFDKGQKFQTVNFINISGHTQNLGIGGVRKNANNETCNTVMCLTGVITESVSFGAGYRLINNCGFDVI